MRVFEVENRFLGASYVTDDLSCLENDLHIELDDFGVEKVKFNRNDIKSFVGKCNKMQVGESLQLSRIKVNCIDIEKSEFEEMPEFMGW